MSVSLVARARFAGDLRIQEVPELFVTTGRDHEATLALDVASLLAGTAAGERVALLSIRSPRSEAPDSRPGLFLG